MSYQCMFQQYWASCFIHLSHFESHSPQSFFMFLSFLMYFLLKINDLTNCRWTAVDQNHPPGGRLVGCWDHSVRQRQTSHGSTVGKMGTLFFCSENLFFFCGFVGHLYKHMVDSGLSCHLVGFDMFIDVFFVATLAVVFLWSQQSLQVRWVGSDGGKAPVPV